MKDIIIIDLIIEDINKFLIKEKISQVKTSLIQSNGVPIFCEGDISAEDKIKVNNHLKKYKDKYEIIKIIINHRFGSTSNMEDKIGKRQLGKRYKNFLKNESELMGLLGAENIIKLKNH